MLLDGAIPTGAAIPAVEGELPDQPFTPAGKPEFPLFEQASDQPDAISDAIFGGDDKKPSMPADTGDKAGGRRVDDHRLNFPRTGKRLQCLIIFLIGHLAPFPAGVIVELVQPIPNPIPLPPQPHGSGVDGAIIAGEEEPAAGRRLIEQMHRRIKHWVNRPLRSDPFPQHKPLVETA